MAGTSLGPLQWSWRFDANSSCSVAVPCLVVASVNAKLRWDAHWEHVAHDTPKEDKPEYAYQNIRTKNFWWGDGDKVCSLPRPLVTPVLIPY